MSNNDFITVENLCALKELLQNVLKIEADPLSEMAHYWCSERSSIMNILSWAFYLPK